MIHDIEALKTADWSFASKQLTTSKSMLSKFWSLPVVLVELGGKEAIGKDWTKAKIGDHTIDPTMDLPIAERHQFGALLVEGVFDIDIDGKDPRLARCIKAGLHHYNVDTRSAFGRRSLGVPSHFLVKVSGDMGDRTKFSIPDLSRDGKTLRVELRSAPTSKDGGRKTHHTVLPGGV